MFGIDFCECKNEIQVLAQVFLKTPTLHAVTAEIIELSNRKNLKETSFISSQRTIMKHETWNMKHETRVAKSEKSFQKLHRFKHEWKIPFFFSIFYAKQEVETLRKKGGVSSHTWQLQEEI